MQVQHQKIHQGMWLLPPTTIGGESWFIYTFTKFENVEE
jgi:hypothetical protein